MRGSLAAVLVAANACVWAGASCLCSSSPQHIMLMKYTTEIPSLVKHFLHEQESVIRFFIHTVMTESRLQQVKRLVYWGPGNVPASRCSSHLSVCGAKSKSKPRCAYRKKIQDKSQLHMSSIDTNALSPFSILSWMLTKGIFS